MHGSSGANYKKTGKALQFPLELLTGAPSGTCSTSHKSHLYKGGSLPESSSGLRANIRHRRGDCIITQQVLDTQPRFGAFVLTAIITMEV
jgi:hypothetical protein